MSGWSTSDKEFRSVLRGLKFELRAVDRLKFDRLTDMQCATFVEAMAHFPCSLALGSYDHNNNYKLSLHRESTCSTKRRKQIIGPCTINLFRFANL
jgi:hypothetical protein